MTTPEPSQQSSSPAPSPAPQSKKTAYLTIGLVVLAVIGLLAYYQQSSGTPGSNGQVVATVNGEEITRPELENQMQQLSAAGQLPPVDELGEERATAERSVLDQMVANRLLLADAASQGITVSDTQVDNEFQTISTELGVEGNDFDNLLAEQGLTADELRQSLHEQLVLEQYFARLSQEHDLTVTDEEVQQVFDEQVGDNDQGITLDAVAPQIRQQLEQQKLAEIIPNIIAELTEEADVQILL